MELTKSQEKALIALNQFIDTPVDLSKDYTRLMLFSGAAGTGKTVVASEFLREYVGKYPRRKIACIAPSHKAKKNLANNLGDLANSITDICTTARFLGLKPAIQDNGSQAFVKSGGSYTECLPSEYDLTVIDEAWMIDSKQVNEIVATTTGKVLFVGDSNQLAPVGEKVSILESWTYTVRSYMLTEVIRYSGELLRVASSYTSIPPVDTQFGKVSIIPIQQYLPIEQTIDDSIMRLSKLEWIEKAASDTSKGKDIRVITYTNAASKKWNQFIRRELYGKDLDLFNPGDKILCRKPLWRDGKNAVENSSELIVLDKAETKTAFIHGMSYDYSSVPCDLEGYGKFDLIVIHPDSVNQLDASLTNLANLAKQGNKRLWSNYYSLLNFFDDITFNYAITCHKAQGSTYESTYLDLIDLNKCNDKKRILYTALTRAKQAYIY